jgi:hypothetical protein
MTKNGLQTQVKDRKPQPLTAVLQKWRYSASYDSEVVNQNFVLRMKFSGENRHLRKAAKRYAQCQKTPYTNEQTDKTQNRKPTLGKIKRGASHHTKPSLLHHI